MIHVELTIEDLDYDTLIDRFLPTVAEKLHQSSNPVAMLVSNGMPASMAKAIIKQLPQDKKNQLAADLINQFRAKIEQGAEQAAAQQGIHVSVCGLKASTDEKKSFL